MGDFFKGWRRKSGCVLLVMTGLLMGAWLRSRLIHDTFSMRIDNDSVFQLAFTD